jgi:hypothetical protein
VTVALSALGALVGAVLGALSMLGLYIAIGGWRHPGVLGAPLAVAALFGGALGLVLAPVAAWTLMRHVPLWRAIAETSLGTVLGFAAGCLLVPWLGPAGPSPILVALSGFAAAAIRLRLMRGGSATPDPALS